MNFPACKFCIFYVPKVSELQVKYSIPKGNFFAKTCFAESKIMSFRFRYVEVTLYMKFLTPLASFSFKKRPLQNTQQDINNSSANQIRLKPLCNATSLHERLLFAVFPAEENLTNGERKQRQSFYYF